VHVVLESIYSLLIISFQITKIALLIDIAIYEGEKNRTYCQTKLNTLY
jgi:hypothetical protein